MFNNNWACDDHGYKLIVEAFKALGEGRCSRVAQSIRIDRRTAKKAWEIGFKPDYPAVKDVLSGAAPLPPGCVDIDVGPIERPKWGKASVIEAMARKITEKEPQNPRPTDSERPAASKTVDTTHSVMTTSDDINAICQSPDPKEAAAAALAKARMAAVAQLEKESDTAGLFLANTQEYARMSARLLGALGLLMTAAEAEVKSTLANHRKVRLPRVVKMVDDVGKALQRGTEMFESTVKTQRLVVGAPQEITEERHKSDTPAEGQGQDIVSRMLEALNAGRNSATPAPEAAGPVTDAEYKEIEKPIDSGNPVATESPDEDKPK